MLIDTHCHLSAPEFSENVDDIAQKAFKDGVSRIVIPSVDVSDFSFTSSIAKRNKNCFYALGIHPMYVPKASDDDLSILRKVVKDAMDDDKFVAIGEIGMDYYLPEFLKSPLRERMEYFFVEQLKIAREFDLPTLLHLRRAQDEILKNLRKIGGLRGIAHAFSGSMRQAQAFMDLGFKISFCGTATYERAQRLHSFIKILPFDSIVLETDAPDLPPSWLKGRRNTPLALPEIARYLSDLRGEDFEVFARKTSENALAALPRLS